MDDVKTFAFSIITIDAAVPQIRTLAIIMIFILFDIITGLIKSVSTHSYQSSVMRQGLFHKLGELICFIFGVLCDIVLPEIGVQLPVSIAQSIGVYVVIMEIGSVVENIGEINPDLAKYLHRIFAKFEDVKDAEFTEIKGDSDNGNSDT